MNSCQSQLFQLKPKLVPSCSIKFNGNRVKKGKQKNCNLLKKTHIIIKYYPTLHIHFELGQNEKESHNDMHKEKKQIVYKKI